MHTSESPVWLKKAPCLTDKAVCRPEKALSWPDQALCCPDRSLCRVEKALCGHESREGLARLKRARVSPGRSCVGTRYPCVGLVDCFVELRVSWISLRVPRVDLA